MAPTGQSHGQFSGLSEEVGANLADRRRELDVSMRSVAAKAGVSPSHLSEIEKGKSQVSLPVLLRLVRALDITVSDLLPRIGGRRVRAGSLSESNNGAARLSHDELELTIEHRVLPAGDQTTLPNPGLNDLLVHVLEGRVTIEAMDVRHHLAAGDTFDSERLPHAIVIAETPSSIVIAHRQE